MIDIWTLDVGVNIALCRVRGRRSLDGNKRNTDDKKGGAYHTGDELTLIKLY